MGARDLYIAMYLMLIGRKTRKPLARFYTGGKSLISMPLIWMAAGCSRAGTFQAWGRRGPEITSVNMGTLSLDNLQPALALHFDDPKSGRTRCVFVTSSLAAVARDPRQQFLSHVKGPAKTS